MFRSVSFHMHLHGIHHVTAIAGDPKANLAFYTQVLGLRLVKKTVNFDDPGTYHLYYADGVGTPGSVMTFFPWSGIPRGRVGAGQASATAWSVAADALPFWRERLRSSGHPPSEFTRFGEHGLCFADPDGLVLEIIATAAADTRIPWAHPDIPAASGLRGFHSVTLSVADASTARVLVDPMGFRKVAQEGRVTRFATGQGGPGAWVDVREDTTVPRGRSGSGTVHHVAFRTTDDTTHSADLAAVTAAGLRVSPVMDRNYFHSIYFREPAGILFEIATDGPGFAVDEPVESLGTRLMLPAQYESRRSVIEASLPPLG